MYVIDIHLITLPYLLHNTCLRCRTHIFKK